MPLSETLHNTANYGYTASLAAVVARSLTILVYYFGSPFNDSNAELDMSDMELII